MDVRCFCLLPVLYEGLHGKIVPEKLILTFQSNGRLMNPFQSVLKWFLRVFISFLIVTALLASWFVIKEKYQVYDSVQSELTLLKLTKQELEKMQRTQESAAAHWLDSLSQASEDQLLVQIRKVESDISKRESERMPVYEKGAALLKGNVDPLKSDMELMVLKNVLVHLQKLHENVIKSQSRESALVRLESLRLEHVAAYEALMLKEKEWIAFRSEGHREVQGVHFAERRVMPFSLEWHRMKKLEQEYEYLFRANQAANQKYQQQVALLNSIRVMPLDRFKVSAEYTDKVLQPLNEKIEKLEIALQNTWAKHFAGPVSAAIPVAFGIILMALLMPIGIKTFLYYVIAPMVSRKRAICLMPGALGNFRVSSEMQLVQDKTSSISAVSQEIHIDEHHELLVHPEYLQSTSASGRKDTKFLLDWRIPLTSLLAGLMALTRIRGAAHASYVISSTKDPLSEIGVIEIPEGTAVVIQPRYLVGIVQRTDAPIVITRRWQLNRLNAWLTLQIRYFIFHGPAKLILKVVAVYALKAPPLVGALTRLR